MQQYYVMNSQLKGMSAQMTTMASYQTIVQSLKGSSAVLQKMNEQMDIASIRNVLNTFTKESYKSEAAQDAVIYKI